MLRIFLTYTLAKCQIPKAAILIVILKANGTILFLYI